jgi:hypothetical protein
MSTTSRRLVWALRVLALVLIGLQLAAPLSSEAVAWGLWPSTYLPAGWRWALALVAAALALFGDRLLRLPGIGLETRLNHLKPGSWQVRLAVAAAAVIPLYLFRIRHLRWGDAYILTKAIPHPDVRLTYVWQAPLDVWLHAKAWALGNRLFGWPDPIPAYWIVSVLAGAAFIWTLLGLANWLERDKIAQVILIGLIATLGTMELFFGYIENYTIMTLGVLIAIWLALRALKGEIAVIWPATALAITHAFHPATIILAPCLLYVAWAAAHRDAQSTTAEVPGLPGSQGRQQAAFLRNLAGIAIPYVLVFLGTLALMSAGRHGLDALLGADFPGGGDRRWFVPLFRTTTRWEHYTMFSLGHLLDIVNEQLLVAPVVLPGLLLTAIVAWRRLPRRDPAVRLLVLMSACYLLLAVTWNPDYGGQRDWDLFAPAALPMAVLLAYLLPQALPEGEALKAAGWALVTAQAFHTVAWIYQNTLPLEIR